MDEMHEGSQAVDMAEIQLQREESPSVIQVTDYTCSSE